MTHRDAFVQRGRPRWDRLETLLLVGPDNGQEWLELSGLYRGVCADLAAARSGRLPQDVVGYLDGLAGRAHNRLYAVRSEWWDPRALVPYLFRDFPRTLRQNGWFFFLATALFYLPFVLGWTAGALQSDFATAVLPEEALAGIEASYRERALRTGGQNAQMAGYYVFNNVGIAFRTFATGALAGLGSVFFLVYNGLVIGTVFGHLQATGNLGNLLEFTSGHSAWELTGIVVSGAAGLKLGWSLVVTNGLTRSASMRRAGPEVLRLVAGAAALILIAAAIEGFWSATEVPRVLKFAFGALQVPIVAAWLGWGGRQ